jgi:predicted branched-subunit amino acid permease
VFGTLAGQARLGAHEGAVFLALIAGIWKERSNILPWTAAVAAHHWLPGQWYILLGGLAGSGSLPAAMVTGVGTVLALRALEANLP